jgi:colicin import membrane protein
MRTYATTAEHLALAPPEGAKWGLPAGLALGVHALLVVALAWGVSWRDEPEVSAVSAELWSRLPQDAAPPAVAPAAPPPPPERTKPAVPLPPPARAQAQNPQDADIALRQREKVQREREEARRLEQERKQEAAKERAAQVARDKAKADEARRQAEQKKQQLAQQQAEADKKRRDEEARKERRAKEEAARKERAEAKQADARNKAEQAALDKNRDEQIRRQMAQLGSATGSGGSGQAAQSSGPSAGYSAKVAARIRPNIRFDDDLPGNPVVELRVRTAPDGTIVARTVHKSSGHPAWDQAALRAMDRTGNLPRDTDGRVPSDLIIELRPKEQ